METTQRQTYLDWLRIASIAGVLFFHAGMPYVAETDWHIRNGETSRLLQLSNGFLHLFRMPLLFFVSGTVSYYMMQRRSALSFIGLRFTRLFIPLAVGMVVVVPPQIYMERLTQGFQGTYWDFYPTVFQFVPYPKGNFSWHHLWFIAYLFLYDLLFAPLFMWLISPKSEGFKRVLDGLSRGKWVYLLAVPSIAWYFFFSKKYPETNNLIHDPCYFVYWLTFLLAGFVCILQPTLLESLRRNRRFAVAVGFVSLLAWYYCWLSELDARPSMLQAPGFVYGILRPLIAWSWVLGLVGYGKQYLNRPHPVLGYLNQAVYPFYILHQTVMVILAYYIVQSTDTILLKYLYTVGTTLFVSMGIYHLFIRPVPVLRALFGMKPAEKPTKAVPSAEALPPSTAVGTRLAQ